MGSAPCCPSLSSVGDGNKTDYFIVDMDVEGEGGERDGVGDIENTKSNSSTEIVIATSKKNSKTTSDGFILVGGKQIPLKDYKFYWYLEKRNLLPQKVAIYQRFGIQVKFDFVGVNSKRCGPDPHEYWTASVLYPGFESLGPFSPSTKHPDVVLVANGPTHYFFFDNFIFSLLQAVCASLRLQSHAGQ